MNKQNSFFSSSFLSKLNSNDFFEIAKDIPDAVQLENTENITATDSNFQISGTHLLIPSSSFSQLIADQNLLVNNEQYLNVLPAPSTQVDFTAVSNIPSVEPFAGICNLELKINSENVTNIKKNTSWTFSKKLNKLYCCPGVSCPIDLSVSTPPAPGSMIRATAVFAKAEHIQSLIQRCENHQKKRQFEPIDEQATDSSILSHFIRSQHKAALYHQDMFTARQSVLVPYEKPPTGSEWTTILYQFMCFSSCLGGSQKPVKIVITLESNNQILGRQVFELKVCASPGRDRNTEETKPTKRAKRKDPDNNTVTEAPISLSPQALLVKRSMSSARSISNSADDEVFTLQVKGRKNYEMLKHIRDSFEAHSAISKLKRIVSGQKTLVADDETSSASSSPKRKKSSSVDNLTNSLEEFLENIDMAAYYSLITSKNVKTLENLLSCNRKRVNAFGISESDTRILWASIQTAKLKPTSPVSASKRQSLQAIEKQETSQAGNRGAPKASVSFLRDSFFTESFFEISKYDIKLD